MKLTGCVGFITLLVAMLIGNTLMAGYVLFVFWGWFVVPLGVPAIGIIHAFGIALTVRLFVQGMTENTTTEKLTKEVKEAKDTEEMASLMISKFIQNSTAYVLTLGMGYLVHVFM